MNIQRKSKGFTIIEVVLVLAIAGLIFLMVFIALPALQRSQRDTQRKSDLSRAQVAITNYTTNSRGALPANTNTAWATFSGQYLTPKVSDTFIDPLGNNTAQDDARKSYEFILSTTTPLTGAFDVAVNQNVIYFSEGYTCGASGDSIVPGGNRVVALRMYLEGGGITCVNI